MVIGFGLLVMASLVVGALAAARFRLPPRLAALITAFGGGSCWRPSRASCCRPPTSSPGGGGPPED